LIGVFSYFVGLNLFRELGAIIAGVAAVFEIKRLVEYPISTKFPVFRKICVVAEFGFLGIGGVIEGWSLLSLETNGLWVIVMMSLVWAATIAYWVSHRGWLDISRGEPAFSVRHYRIWLLPLLCAFILVPGYWLVEWDEERIRKQISEVYFAHAHMIISSLGESGLSEISTGEADGQTYRHISFHLRSVQEENKLVLECAIIGEKDSEIVYKGGEILGEGAVSDYLFEDKRYWDKKAFVGASIHKEEGRRLSVNVPLREDSSKIGWLVLELESRKMQAALVEERLTAELLLGMLTLLIAGWIVHHLRLESEKKLLLEREKSDGAEKAKNEFMAMISHEIRTPLQSVLGFSELISGTELDSEQKGYVTMIRSQGKTLLRIIQDILDLGVLRSGEFALKLEPTVLKKLLEEVAATARPLVEEKGLVLHLKLDENIPENVMADPVRLRQILLNLLGNAAKFTKEGWVLLEAKTVQDDKTRKGNEKEVIFSVSDTGKGIRSGWKDRLFKPFFQGGFEGLHNVEGVGLGLAITHRLCRLMRGHVDVSPRIGGGSVFRVRLPFFESGGKNKESVGQLSGFLEKDFFGGIDAVSESYPLKILVAEDNEGIQNLLVEYLRKLGYSPDRASDGSEAVEACREVMYDVVLMDLRMPVMDGFHVTSEIRKMNESIENPWIIGISARASEEDVNAAFESGMNDFLSKPIHLEGLVETIFYSPILSAPSGWVEKLKELLSDEFKDDSPSLEKKGWVADEGEIADFTSKECAGIIGGLREALQTGDRLMAQNRAHHMTNYCMYLGFTEAEAYSQVIDDLAEKGLFTEALLNLDLLERAMKPFRGEVLK
jgi:signal transduction histidine kinase/CheY-like chemotaxis protein